MKILIAEVSYVCEEFIEVKFRGTVNGLPVAKVQLFDESVGDKTIGDEYIFHITDDAIFNTTLVGTCIRSKRL